MYKYTTDDNQSAFTISVRSVTIALQAIKLVLPRPDLHYDKWFTTYFIICAFMSRFESEQQY